MKETESVAGTIFTDMIMGILVCQKLDDGNRVCSLKHLFS